MQAYTNPAFRPAFVSRIPKPTPHRPPEAKDPQPATHLGNAAQQLLKELPSTSHMQPAWQPHALPAGFEPEGALHEAQHAQHRAVQGATDLHTSQGLLDTTVPALSSQHQQHDDSSVWQHDSSVQLFQLPGHEVMSVVWDDDSQVESQQHGIQAAARTAGHALHAGQESMEQGSGARDEEQHHFADGCRRLVAVIEVGSSKHHSQDGRSSTTTL